MKQTLSVLIMLSMLLSACTMNPGATPAPAPTAAATATPQPTAAATAAPAAETAAPTSAISELNAKYPLITDPNINEPGTFPLVKEPVTLTVAMAQDVNVLSYAYEENFLTRYMQDKTNVVLELEMFPSVDAEQKIEIMINSNAEMPDVLLRLGMGDTARFRNGQMGLLIPLNDYYDQLAVELRKGCEQNGAMSYDDILKYLVSPDGNLYGVAQWTESIQDRTTLRAWFNMEFLDALGMGLPQKQDEFVEVLKAFRDLDPNGNGQQDEIPMVGAVGGWNTDVITWVMQQYMYVNSKDQRYMLIENGVLDVAYDKDEWREGLRFIKYLVDEELISTLSFTQDGSQYNALCQAEVPIVGLGVSGSISGFGPNIYRYEGFDVIEGPKGVKHCVYFPPMPFAALGITKYCKNPEIAFLWGCSLLNDQEYNIIYQFGEPGVDWEVVTDPNAKSMFDEIGIPGGFVQLNQVWGNPTNSNWQGGALPIIRVPMGHIGGQVWDGNENNNERKNAKCVMRIQKFMPDKSKVFAKNVYTPDEVEQTAEIRTNLRLYIDEASVLFVTGAMDIERDWDKYLQELEKLQYKEILAVDQTAYTRTQQGVN